MGYIAYFVKRTSGERGQLALDAASDAAAISEASRFVEANWGGTTASVDLADGRTFQVYNESGRAKGIYLAAHS